MNNILKYAIIIALALPISACHKPKVATIANEAASQVFLGNGVQWSAYPHADSPQAEWGLLMTNDRWEMAYQRLDFMKPGIIRVMDQAGWRYFKGVDGHGKPILCFNSPEIDALVKLLTYCQRNSITVIFGEWGAPAFWGEPGNIARADDPRWIGMITEYLRFLILEKGFTCIKYYNLVNEPNGSWASTDGDWEQWRDGAIKLADSFKDSGLDKYVTLAAPDVVASYDNPRYKITGVEWVERTMLEISGIVGIYDIHSYPDGGAVRQGKLFDFLSGVSAPILNANKPILLGELGLKYSGELGEENARRAKADTCAGDSDSQMFVYEFFYGIDVVDALIQSMQAGYSGAIAWDLDDAMHTEEDKGELHRLKRWGMWNSLGDIICSNPADTLIRPWFYPWSLMCRYFPPNTSILRVEYNTSPSLRMIAGKKNGDYTFACVNNSEKPETFVLRGDHAGELTMKRYIYSNGDRPVDNRMLPTPIAKERWNLKAGVLIEIPANSFILCTSYKY